MNDWTPPTGAQLDWEKLRMTDNPTKCECCVAFDDDYPDMDNAEIIRCDWCKGLEAELTRLREQGVKTWEERDAFAKRIDARDKEANDMQAQLQAANAVCEEVSDAVCEPPLLVDHALRAWRATQKGDA